jgi:SAM-dependent methyltransferase
VGVDSAALVRLTQGVDGLRGPLTPTREASLRDDATSLAVRKFFCREEMVESVEDAAWIGAGLLVRGACGTVIAPFHLRIVRGLYLFSDYLNDESDAVMGAGETTAVLYQAARPRSRVGRVYDLGCGAGTLALLLAREAEYVLGTDVNPRAVTLAQFNAAANGIQNAEFRCGDLYEPARGERFDLIVSQPPYYPGSRLTFLHGGERGDELPTRVLEGLPDHLTPTGRGLVFTSWPEARELLVSPMLRHLELRTNRRELHGTRQSIDVVEHAARGWSCRMEVPADCWGEVQAWRIDQIFAAQELLRDGIGNARLRLPRGAVKFEEGGDVFLRCPAESLVKFAPIDESTWAVLDRIDRGGAVGPADLAIVEAALKRGLLVPDTME